MKVDLDKFLVCDKKEKRIYGKKFGFISISCIPSKFNVTAKSVSIGSKTDYYVSSNTVTTSLEKIYAVYENHAAEEGNKVEKYIYKKFSFNHNLLGGVKFAIKIEDKYYEIINGSFLAKLRVFDYTNRALLTQAFGSVDDIFAFQLKEILEREEWIEDEENEIKVIKNIRYFEPGKKIFIDRDDGGEGVIVRLKEFCFSEKKAIFEIKLYDGRKVDVDFLDEIRRSRITLKAIEKKDYAQTSELFVLDDSLNEDKLNPFIRYVSEGFNIYWQPVAEAAGYTVELYSWWEQSVAEKLYLMERRVVDRNKFYTTFVNLSRGKYYVRVMAEDREGSKIALNKAINLEI